MAGTQRITVLQHISHEAPEGGKWQVNDVANISTKLLTASFYASVDKTTYVSIYSAERQEVQEKHNIEISTQTEPHSVLMNKDESTLVVCVGMNIQFYQASNGKLQKTVILEKVPSCTCRGEEGLLVATANSSTIQSFSFEAIQTKNVVLEGLDQSDYPTDMTMVGDVIYLCTKKYGQALSYDQHGVKLSAFKSNDEQNYKANSIAVHREKELVFILWNKCNVLVYSHLSNESLFSVDFTSATKVRLIDDYMMILIVPEKNEILVYDVEALVDFAMLKTKFLATLEEKACNDILTESKQHKSRQNQSLTKSESELSSDETETRKVFNIRNHKKHQQQKMLLKLFDELHIKYGNYKANIERDEKQLHEIKTASNESSNMGSITKDTVAVLTENMKIGLRGLIDGTLHDTLELTKQEKDVTEELELTKSTLTKKEVDLLQIQVELDAAISKQMDLKKTVTKTEELYQIIEAKKREIQQLRMQLKKAQTEVENAKTKVTILQDRKHELEKSLSREQKRSKELEKLFLNLEDADNRLNIENEKAAKNQTSFSYLNEKINELEFTKKEMESQQNKSKDTLVREKGKVTREERLRVQLKERIKELEITRKELESQQKKLKDNLVQEKGKVTREKRSRVQVVTNLKKVEDRNTKLEYEVTQLKERLLAEEMTAKELQTSSPKLIERIKELESIKTALESQQKKLKDNLVQEKRKLTREERSRVQLKERMKKLEFTRKELESQQKKLKDNLVQEKRKVSREERSRVQLNEHIKELEFTRTELESQQKKLKDNLVQEKGKVTRKEKSRVQAVTNLKKVEEMNTKLEDQVTQLKDRLLAEELTAKDLQTSFLKILEDLDRDALILKTESEVFKEILQTEEKQQDVLVCLQSESSEKLKVLQQSAFFESVDALVKEISNGKSKLEKLKNNRDKTVEESEVQRDWFDLSELQVSLVVSQDGGKLKIPGSDVSLDIPPDALQEQREIQMKIIPHCLDPGDGPLSFSSNSSVVVELLPNNLQFQRTVHLRLPHCLHLNDKYNSLTDVEVLISHHEKGDIPKWDASTDTACKLQKDHCVVRLNKFCWITYRVDDKVVTAKRLKIFTAGRDLELSDRVSEVEVGYFPDLPGGGEILRKNPKLNRGQIKPFLFRKDEEESTLLISLQQVIPTEWQNNIEHGDQQIISYQSICTGTEMSCPFHLQYTPEGSPSGKVPLCLFHVTQKNAEQINITFRPEVKCDED